MWPDEGGVGGSGRESQGCRDARGTGGVAEGVIGLGVAGGPRLREKGEPSLDLPSNGVSESRELLKASSQSLAMLLLKCLSSCVRKAVPSCSLAGLTSIFIEALVAQLSREGLQWLDGEVISRS